MEFLQYIRFSLELTAKELFGKVDSRLNPRILFVGLRTEDYGKNEHVWIFPDNGEHSTEWFHDLSDRVGKTLRSDAGQPLVSGERRSGERYLSDKSHANVIREILERHDESNDNDYYVGLPGSVDGVRVFTVLVLDKNRKDKFHSLVKKEKSRGLARAATSRSLIESMANVFLRECSIALKNSHGSDLKPIKRREEELLKEAGAELMLTVSHAGGNAFYGLFESCNEIASMRYEGAVGIGDMIIAPSGHPNVRLTLELKTPIRLLDYRKARKFLELSDQSGSIISDSVYIYGLGELLGPCDPEDESLFVVRFLSHFKWELLHDNHTLMVIENKIPALPGEKINREKFYSDFPRIFRGITRDQIDHLWEAALESTRQKHGTMLVVNDDAESEAIRLGGQSFVVKPFKLDKEKIRQVSAIDGAVLVDRDGMCHAVGVILDGLATPKGDSARGARYNSAVRYYEWFCKKTPLAIVIVSEDGMIDMLPDLLPPIEHSIITDEIGRLKAVYEAEEFDPQSFSRLIHFFEFHETYLNKTECDEINQYRRSIENKFGTESVAFRTAHRDFVPNDVLNDGYFF